MKKQEIEKSNNLINHFFIAGFGVFISMALGLISAPIMFRVADPIDYGRLTIFNTYASILVSIVFLGLDQALIRFFYECKDINEKRRLLRLCIFIPFLISIFAIIVFYVLVKLEIVSFDFTNIYILLLVLFVIITVFNTLCLNVLRLVYNSKIYSLCTAIQKIIYCIILVSCVFLDRNYFVMIIILANIISFLIPTIVGVVSSKELWKINKMDMPTNSKDILKYSLPLMLHNVIFTVFDSMDKLLVKKYCTEAEVGIYSSALTIVGIILLIKTAFEAIWYPAQTEHFTNNYEDKDFIKKGNRYITIIMFFVGINFIMFKDIVCLLLGQSYRDASQIIPFLIFNPIMLTISLTTISGIEVSKKSYLQTIIAFVCLVLYLVLGNLLIPIFGLKGAAICVAISYIVLFILRLLLSNKFYYIDYEFKKTFISIIVLFVFAYINTYYSINVYVVIIYIISMYILWMLYRKDIIDMILFVKDKIFNKNAEE